MKILILEENNTIINSLEYCLKKENHDIIKSGNQNNAIQTLKQNTFDLIIVDIETPDFSDFKIIALVKNKHQHTKIIAVSSLNDKDIISKTLTQDVDDFLTKPFKPEELNLRIQRFNRQCHKKNS